MSGAAIVTAGTGAEGFSSRDGLVPLVKAVLGLGIAGADGMGDFSLKTSGVGREGHCGESV